MSSSKQFLPKGPSPVTITSEVKASTYDLWGGDNSVHNMLKVAERIAQLGREESQNWVR